jgi:hypothetical protein
MVHSYFSFFKNIFIVYITCTGSFIMTFPYMCTMYPGLFHPLHFSPSPQLPLLKMTPTGLSVLYLYMYRKHTDHIHPLHLPSPPH